MQGPYARNFFLLFVSVFAMVALFVVVGFAFWQKGHIFFLGKQPTPKVEESLLPPQRIPDRNSFSNESHRQVFLDDDGSGYSTYRDKDYGFEVKFPKDWRLKVSKGGDFSGKKTILVGFHFSPDSMCCDFAISIYVTRGSLEEEMGKIREGWKTEQEKLPVSNLDVVRVFDPEGAAPYYIYLLERRGLVFTFTGEKMAMGEPTTDVFEGIVRSFKFIE